MLAHLRERPGWRRALALAGLLALALRLLAPAGFMPGTSLASPIVLCPDQGAMPDMATPGMAMPGDPHGHPAPHRPGDHPCAFAGLGATPLAGGTDVPAPVPAGAAEVAAPATYRLVAPGRGMAAPPPPSRAPPHRPA